MRVLYYLYLPVFQIFYYGAEDGFSFKYENNVHISNIIILGAPQALYTEYSAVKP